MEHSTYKRVEQFSKAEEAGRVFNNIKLIDIFPESPVIEQEKIDMMHIDTELLYNKKHHKVKRQRRRKDTKLEEDKFSLSLREI